MFIQESTHLEINFDDVYRLAEKRGVDPSLVDSAAIIYSSQNFEDLASGVIGYTGPGLVCTTENRLHAPVICLRPIRGDKGVNPNLRHEISHWGDPDVKPKYYNPESISNLRLTLASLGGLGVNTYNSMLESIDPVMKGTPPEVELAYEGARFGGLSLGLGITAVLSSRLVSVELLQRYSPRELGAQGFSLLNCHINPIHRAED